jgi:16S rRNA (guanine966-N2)-methyltransferase
MARIIGGQSGGRVLVRPKGDGIRPTAARVRQTLFDILAPRMRGASFLDVCAGSGAVGIEAASRGASRVVLFDIDQGAADTARSNALLVRELTGNIEVHRRDARLGIPGLARGGARFDVVFVDPPYASPLYEELISLVSSSSLLAPGGILVAEHFKKRALPETIGALSRFREVRVGDHVLSFYRVPAPPEPALGGDDVGEV